MHLTKRKKPCARAAYCVMFPCDILAKVPPCDGENSGVWGDGGVCGRSMGLEGVYSALYGTVMVAMGPCALIRKPGANLMDAN